MLLRITYNEQALRMVFVGGYECPTGLTRSDSCLCIMKLSKHTSIIVIQDMSRCCYDCGGWRSKAFPSKILLLFYNGCNLVYSKMHDESGQIHCERYDCVALQCKMPVIFFVLCAC